MKLNLLKPHKISTHFAYSDNCYYHFFYFFWLSWYFVRFQEILFQTDSESFSFLSWKPKKFYCWKKKFLSRFQFKNKKALFTGAIFPKFFIFFFTDLNFDTLKHPTYSNLYRENPQNYEWTNGLRRGLDFIALFIIDLILRQNQAWRKETVLKDTKKLLEQLSKQCRNQEKRTNFSFHLAHLASQTEKMVKRITQPKRLKTKNEDTKISDAQRNR